MFLARSRMLDLAENFKKGEKNSKTQCPMCEEPESDSQPHLMTCPNLVLNQQLVPKKVDYEQLFETELNEQVQVAMILKEILNKR